MAHSREYNYWNDFADSFSNTVAWALGFGLADIAADEFNLPTLIAVNAVAFLVALAASGITIPVNQEYGTPEHYTFANTKLLKRYIQYLVKFIENTVRTFIAFSWVNVLGEQIRNAETFKITNVTVTLVTLFIIVSFQVFSNRHYVEVRQH